MAQPQAMSHLMDEDRCNRLLNVSLTVERLSLRRKKLRRLHANLVHLQALKKEIAEPGVRLGRRAQVIGKIAHRTRYEYRIHIDACVQYLTGKRMGSKKSDGKRHTRRPPHHVVAKVRYVPIGIVRHLL